MKYFSKVGVLACALMGLAVVGCKSKEEPDDPNRPNRHTEETSETALDHLIIEEIFYVGNYYEQTNGSIKVPLPYKQDAYIKIYNPTKETKYLDGLVLLMSQFSSNKQHELGKDADFRETHVGASTVLQFPGTGKEYALEPGKSVLVARAAMDHTQDREDGQKGCPTSLDLSKADFQWMTPDQIEEDELPVSKNVPSLKVVYADNSFGDQDSRVMEIHQGTGLLALAKLGVDNAKLESSEYEWSTTYKSLGSHAHTGNATMLKIPNDWIIDAVNLCPKEGFKWYIASKDLDKGWTNTIDGISKVRPLGKALRRKHNGKSYEDTNNSTTDFEEVEASYRKK